MDLEEAQVRMWYPSSFLSTTSLHLASILNVLNPSFTPPHTNLEEKGEILIYKRLLPLTEGHQWWYSKILVIMTPENNWNQWTSYFEITIICLGYICRSKFPTQTCTHPRASYTSICTAPSQFWSQPLYLWPHFPLSFQLCQSVQSFPHTTTHAKNKFLFFYFINSFLNLIILI